MLRRRFCQLLAAQAMGGVIAACGGKKKEATGQAGASKVRVPESIGGAQGSPAAQAAPAQARGEPKGRMVYGWHTSISPAWLDPQENPALITPYAFQYALHDALVRHLPGKPLAPSLAESSEFAADQQSATFKLRPGIMFHNGDPVTPEDVKFTYENYRGTQAKILKDRTDRIELVDERTIRFHFKEPFPDFMILYGSPATGAGWVVPKKYYQQVGPDGFKQKPIGAGPYKFVRQTAGTEIELQAMSDYWRGAPYVKTLIYKAITDDATRFAALQAGEIDFVNLIPGQLIDVVKRNPKLTLAPTLAAPFFLEFPGWEKPGSPFHDIRVRQAVSLALDRKALSDAETGGYSPIVGNWIPDDWPGAIKGPAPAFDLPRAKQLMAEAGVSNGFDVEQLTPLPPYFSLGERVITQLREIGIRTKLNTMERAAFASKLSEGPNALPGIILNISGSPGDAASRVRAFAICKGASSRTCVPELDEKFAQYEKSFNTQERERFIKDIQQYIIDQYIFPPVYRLGFVNAQGPRVANTWNEIWGAIPQYVYIGPYEDIRLKE